MKKYVILLAVVLFVLTGCEPQVILQKYSKEDIMQLILPGKENTLRDELIFVNDGLSYNHGINDENIDAYNKILNQLDKVIGRNKYQVESIFETYRGKGEDVEISYSMYIIPNEFLTQYQNWKSWDHTINPDDPWNPFICTITLNAQGEISGNYRSLILGHQWIADAKKAFAKKFPNYYMNIASVRMFDYDAYLPLDFKGSWREALKEVKKGNSINVFVPYGTSAETINEFVEKNEAFFKEYFIVEIVVVELNESDTYARVQAEERYYLNNYRFDTELYPSIAIFVLR